METEDIEWSVVDDTGRRFTEQDGGYDLYDEKTAADTAILMDRKYPDYAPHTIWRREVSKWEQV